MYLLLTLIIMILHGFYSFTVELVVTVVAVLSPPLQRQVERRFYWFGHKKPIRDTEHTHTHTRENSVKMCSKFDCQAVVCDIVEPCTTTQKQLCCILIDVFSQSESSASIVMTFSFFVFTCALHYSFQVCSHCCTEFVMALHSMARRIYVVILPAFHVCKVRFTVANRCGNVLFVFAVAYKEYKNILRFKCLPLWEQVIWLENFCHK